MMFQSPVVCFSPVLPPPCKRDSAEEKNNLKEIRIYGWAFGLAMLGCLQLAAQQTGISGRMTDPSNASIADGIVRVTGDDASKFATTTNARGIYQFSGSAGRAICGAV